MLVRTIYEINLGKWYEKIKNPKHITRYLHAISVRSSGEVSRQTRWGHIGKNKGL